MRWKPLSLLRRSQKTFLGIDIGTSSVKIVEIASRGKEATLVNYGELKTYGYLRRLREPLQSSVMTTLDSDVAAVIRQILDRSGARSRRASMSIPLFSSFLTMLEFPPMTQTELQEAITFQARQIVPVPISEVILDWETVGRTGRMHGEKSQERSLVLLVAVPREIVDRYVRIAKLAAIELDALEVEAFSLLRGAFYNDPRTGVVIDIGARSTNIVLVDEGTVRLTRSLDTSGSDFTSTISRAMNVEIGRAEAAKIEQGLSKESEEMQKTLGTMVDVIVREVDTMVQTYRRTYGKAVEVLTLSGGSASLLGLEEYMKQALRLSVVRADPFRGIHVQKELIPVLREIGPSFTVAVGLALRHVSGASSA